MLNSDALGPRQRELDSFRGREQEHGERIRDGCVAPHVAVPQPLGQDRKREAFRAVVRVEELARQLAIARVERATDVEIAVRGGRFAQPGGLAEGCVVAEQIRVQGRLGPRGRR